MITKYGNGAVAKTFFFFEIIASQLVVLNCLYLEENTCHRESMC